MKKIVHATALVCFFLLSCIDARDNAEIIIVGIVMISCLLVAISTQKKNEVNRFPTKRS